MFIGFIVLVAAGLLGIVSLLRGNPSVVSGYTGVLDAGRARRRAAAWPLSRVLSPIRLRRHLSGAGRRSVS